MIIHKFSLISIRCIYYLIYSFFLIIVELNTAVLYVAEDDIRLHLSKFSTLNTKLLGVQVKLF